MNVNVKAGAYAPHVYGRAAEAVACDLLRQEGYRIVRRNVRVRGGEIDVVAWDGDVLCFVEVRARQSARYGGARGSITAAKQRRVHRAAAQVIASERTPPRCRFDVVVVEGAAAATTATLMRHAFEGPGCR